VTDEVSIPRNIKQYVEGVGNMNLSMHHRWSSATR